MSDGRISQGDIVTAAAYQEVQDLNARVQELVATFRELKSTAAGFEIKIDGAGGIKDLMKVLKEMASAGKGINTLRRDLAGLTADIAKLAKSQADSASAADKAALAEERLATQRQKTRQETAKADEIERRNTEAKERSAQATAQAEAAERAKTDAQNQANAAAQQAAANHEAEARALYDSVKAHQESAANLRSEAQAKQLAAAQATDAAEKSRLEADAKRLLTAALAEERAAKEEVAAANKKVGATVRDNLAAEALLTRELDRLTTAADRQAASLARDSNAYEQLKREYNEAAYATKQLAAEFVIAQREGRHTTEELERMRQALQAQQEATLAQSNALLQMEQAVGQNQRAVGAYANATGEITQILRELPNFAISAQTGILSLSNNLPMLQASLSRLAQTVDANTGQAIGWRGVLRTLGSSLFSLQGLIVLGTTLLVAYGDQIGEVISRSTDAEKAQKLYNKALEESASKVGEEIGNLVRLRDTMQSTTATRDQVLSSMEKIQALYPGIFNNLNEETRLSKDVNDQIQRQIDLLERKAQVEAANKAVSEAATEMIKTQQALNQETSFFQEIWANTKWLAGAGTSIDKLSDKSKELVKQNYELYKSGVITRNEYHARYYQVLELEKAHGLLNETVKLSISFEDAQIASIDKKIEAQNKEIQNYKDIIEKYGPQMSGTAQKEINDRQRIVDMLEKQKKGYQDAKIAKDALDKPDQPQKTFLEIAIQETEARMKLAKDGSAEELKLKDKLSGLLFAKEIGDLKARYAKEYQLRGADLEANEQYQRDKVSLLADLHDKLEKTQNKFDKKNADKQKFDATTEILSANQRQFEAGQAIDRKMLEETNARLENIFNLETNSLEKRLNAQEVYVNNLQAIEDNEYQSRIKERQAKLAQIAEIEQRIGEEIKEDNLRRVEDLKGVSNEERKLLIEKFALQDELLSETKTHDTELSKIEEEGVKKRRAIVESDTKYRLAVLNSSFASIRDQASAETALRLANLNQQREAGEITEKEFWSARQRIAAGESRLLFDKQFEFLKAEYARMINDPTIPAEVKAALERLKGDLEKVRPEPRKVESRSLLEYLGINSRGDIEMKEAASRVNKARAQLDNAIDEYGTTQEFWANELLRIKQEAADKFGEGSDEYNQAITDATSRQTAGLASAQGAIDMFSRDFAMATDAATESVEKNAEQLKQSIANSLKGLYDTLFRAVDQARDNYYKERFDQLDFEKEKIQENAEAEKNAIESSLLSAEEKQKQLAAIDARKAAADKVADTKERALKRQQAEAARKDAIFKIKMEGGIAAAKALAGAGENPLLAIAAAALIAAQTLANVAMINSQPLPEYWKGTPREGHPFDGPARVGERGTELGVRPDGSMFLTPNRATEMFLEKGTHIIPHEKLAAGAQRSAMVEMSGIQGGATPDAYAAAMAMNYERGMKQLGDRFEESIKKIPVTKMYWEDGHWRKRTEVGNQSVEFLNRFRGWT